MTELNPALSFSTDDTTSDAKLSRLISALQTTKAGQVVYSGSTQSTVAVSAVTNGGQISPVSGIGTTGNTFPFIVQGNFGFVWDGAKLTVYYDGTNGSVQFVIRRADDSQVTVPRGTLVINGLSGSTLYGFAPFFSVAQRAVSFAVGNSGTPRFAFAPSTAATVVAQAVQTQSLTSNERLTDGLVYFTTGAGGASASSTGSTSTGGNPYPGQPDEPQRNDLTQ